MEGKLILAFFFAGLAFAAATSEEWSGSMGSWGDSFEERESDCDRLVEGSDDNDGGCDLTDDLEDVPNRIDCTAEQKTIIINWVTVLKQLLAVKVSVEERLVIALSSIQKFQIENPEIYELIQYQNISSWGYLASFSKVVELRQSTKIESLITLDDDDSCPLFEALFNCTEGSYEQESAVNAFINETLIGICGNMSLTVTERSVLIFQAIEHFFAIHAEWQLSFFQFQIVGFGTFQQFYEITKTYYQKTQVDIVLSGAASECAFLISFQNQITLMMQDTTISMTIKSVMKQFYERIYQQCESVTTVKGRLSIILSEFRSFLIMYPQYVSYCYTIEIDGFGSFMDLIYCAPWKWPVKPVKPTSVVVSPSPKPTCSCTCVPTTVKPSPGCTA